jgi:hypothetical protein
MIQHCGAKELTRRVVAPLLKDCTALAPALRMRRLRLSRGCRAIEGMEEGDKAAVRLLMRPSLHGVSVDRKCGNQLVVARHIQDMLVKHYARLRVEVHFEEIRISKCHTRRILCLW